MDGTSTATARLQALLRPSRDEGVSRAAIAGAIAIHAAIGLAALLIMPLGRSGAGAPEAARITVVLDSETARPAEATRTPAAAPPLASPVQPQTPPSPAPPSQARLDELFGPGAEPAAPAPAPARSRLDSLFGAPAVSRSAAPAPPASPAAARAQTAATAGASAGAAQPTSALQPGEALRGVDLYTVASLPEVGRRPAAPSGDLWARIQPCWRPINTAAVTLAIDIGPGGRLLGQPMAIRLLRPSAESLAAERSAVRAAQACAPYEGVNPGRWRVNFTK